jgi:hypothetical protein
MFSRLQFGDMWDYVVDEGSKHLQLVQLLGYYSSEDICFLFVVMNSSDC